MKTNTFLLKVLIGVFLVIEIFVLFTVLDNAGKISRGGSIVTLSENTNLKSGSGQDLTPGTYVITYDGWVKLNNYWIQKFWMISIPLPLLILVVLIVIYKKGIKDINQPKLDKN